MKGALPIWWNSLPLYSGFKIKGLFTANLLFWVPEDKKGGLCYSACLNLSKLQKNVLACYNGQPENKPRPLPLTPSPSSPRKLLEQKTSLSLPLGQLVPVVSWEGVSRCVVLCLRVLIYITDKNAKSVVVPPSLPPSRSPRWCLPEHTYGQDEHTSLHG